MSILSLNLSQRTRSVYSLALIHPQYGRKTANEGAGAGAVDAVVVKGWGTMRVVKDGAEKWSKIEVHI